MLAARVIHGMEAGDRTADAAHLELKKYPDRLRRSTHDIVNQIVKPNGHAHLRSEMNGNAALPKPVCPGASLGRIPGARPHKSDLTIRLIGVRHAPIATKFRNAMNFAMCHDQTHALQQSRGGFEFSDQACNSSSKASASFRSSVSNPSVNEPWTGASSSRACCGLPHAACGEG